MDLCDKLCSSGGWPDGRLAWQNFNVGHYSQTLQPNDFISPVLIGAIDFYNFMPFLLALTFSEITSSAQSKTSWLYFIIHFK